MPRHRSQPRALIARFVRALLAADKRSSDQIWRVPGGDNPVWPDPPSLPDPPGADRKGNAKRFVPDYSRGGILRVLLLTFCLIAVGLVLLALQRVVA